MLVSARHRRGPRGAAASAIAAEFERTLRDVELLVPFSEGGTLSELHDVAGDLEREDTAEGVRVTARLPAVVAERYDRYAVNGDGNGPARLAAGGAEAAGRRGRRPTPAARRPRAVSGATNGTSSSCAIRSPGSPA